MAVGAHGVDCGDSAEGDDLRSSPPDDDRPPGGEEGGLERRNSAVPWILGLGCNDDVDPGGAKLDADERADQVGDSEGVRSDVRKRRHDESESEGLESMHQVAAIHGTEATSRSKEAECSAERRGNRLAMAGGSRSRGNTRRLGDVVVGDRLDGERCVSGRLLIFDDGEDGEDLFKGVRALGAC